ncbi:hypothetical protein CEP54_002599 [Fusarium duplospermum]|uniref:Uncharacterized protein n=1 Tax=Fusarium duplospermum TaxID=1325734 RepID=A0A428QUQ5_9HYPO|nr:hypothetical protein CEP54_002599 [Fusarium duplospermum]
MSEMCTSQFGAMVCWIINAGRLDLLEPFLRSRHLDWNLAHGDDHRPMLSEAVRGGHLRILERLLVHPNSVDHLDDGDIQGRTALHEAAYLGSCDAIQLLWAKGADMEALDKKLRTPLHLVVQESPGDERSESVLKALLERGSDTPLHNAAAQVNTSLMRLLLSHGADQRIRNADDQVPLDLVPESQRTSWAEIFSTQTQKPLKEVPKQSPSLENPTCKENGDHVCKSFYIDIHLYCTASLQPWFKSASVYELVYGEEDLISKFKQDFIEAVTKETTQQRKQDEATEEEPNVWMWIHLPANNMTWVRDLVQRLNHGLGHPARGEQNLLFLEQTLAQRERHKAYASTRVPHASKGTQTARGREDCNSSKRAGAIATASNATVEDNGNLLSVVFPFLDFETGTYLERHDWDPKDLHKRKVETQRFEKFRRLEHQFAPLRGLSGLQTSQTLDEYYCDMLDRTDARRRAEDQVVWRWSLDKEKRRASAHKKVGDEDEVIDLSEAKLLMVHQLWVWKLHPQTVITALPERWHMVHGCTLLEVIRQGSIVDFDSPERFIAHVVQECATFLDKLTLAGSRMHILDVFEGEAAKVARNEAELVDKLIRSLKVDQLSGFSKSLTNEILSRYSANDIREELKMILHVLGSQKDVIKQFSNIQWPGSDGGQKLEHFLAECRMPSLMERIDKIDDLAGHSFEIFDGLITVKRDHDSEREAKFAKSLNFFMITLTFVTVLYNRIALLAPKDVNKKFDYTAKALGVSTLCKSKGKECRLRVSGNSNTRVVHSCPLEESAGEDTLAIDDCVVDKTETDLLSDYKVIMLLGGAISVLLDCTVKVYNVTYSVQNGTIVPLELMTTIADDAPAYVVADPVTLNFPQNQLYERLRLAAVTSHDSSELASKMSMFVSEMAIAYLAGIFEPLQNEKESTRKAVQVARLPLALVGITVALGIILALQATCFFLIALGLVRKDPNTVDERDRLTLGARVSGAARRALVEGQANFPKEG